MLNYGSDLFGRRPRAVARTTVSKGTRKVGVESEINKLLTSAVGDMLSITDSKLVNFLIGSILISTKSLIKPNHSNQVTM